MTSLYSLYNLLQARGKLLLKEGVLTSSDMHVTYSREIYFNSDMGESRSSKVGDKQE